MSLDAPSHEFRALSTRHRVTALSEVWLKNLLFFLQSPLYCEVNQNQGEVTLTRDEVMH